MGTYRYTGLGAEIPPMPIIPLELIKPGRFEAESVVGQAILDTGSDCTLVPIPWLIQVRAQVADDLRSVVDHRALQIPVGGQVSVAIPYEVGLRFDRYRHFVFRVYGCPVEEIGDMALVGRDLLNLYRVEFDGPAGGVYDRLIGLGWRLGGLWLYLRRPKMVVVPAPMMELRTAMSFFWPSVGWRSWLRW
jgi:hypothetical protein